MGNKDSTMLDAEEFSEEALNALPEGPIQLIEVSEDGALSVGEQAKRALRALGSGKICVVAVAGLYRTGKSSLVNFLLDQEGGFKVGPTVARCTRGIWMWGRPRRATLPSGETAWVLLLDTEGLGGLEADASYDLRMFSLATLLCSSLVYNSLGTIDETAISSLSFVAQLTRHIRINPAHKGEDGEGEDEEHDEEADAELEATQFGRYFPTFTWVLRDFSLDLVDERGDFISPDAYLEQSLQPQPGFDDATCERNRIREMLTAFFSERKCFPLVRPLVDEAKLQEIDKVPLKELRSEFQEQMEELKEFLYFHHLRPKLVNGVALNGSSFVGLAEKYIEAISSGGVPTVTSAWQEVMQKECESALQEALEHYDADVARLMAEKASGKNAGGDDAALELNALVDLHARALKSAIAVFQARAGGEESGAFQVQLEAQLVERFGDLAARNMDRSEERCGEVIQALYKSILEPKLKDGEQGYCSTQDDMFSDGPYAALQADLNILGANYRTNTAAVGPAKGAVLARFYDEQVLDAVRWLAQRLEDAQQLRVEEVRQQMSVVAGKLASVEAREAVYDESIENNRAELLALQTDKLRLESVQSAADARVTTLLAELQARSDQVSQLKLELDETKESIESEQHWQSTLSDKLEKVQRAHEEKSADFASLHAEHTTHKLDSESSILEIKALNERLEDELARTKAQVEATEEQLQFKLGELAHKEEVLTAAREEGAGLQAELTALGKTRDGLVQDHAAAVADFEAAVAKLESDKSTLEGEVQASKEALEGMVVQSETEFREQAAALTMARGEGEERAVTIKSYERLMKQQEKQLSDLRAQGQRKIAQLQGVVEKHKSDYHLAKNQLNLKGSREMEMETRLEQERQLRESMAADKDNQLFGLQKDLQERGSTMKLMEIRSSELQERIESQATEIVQLRAQQSVLLGEKEKQQRMWETAMNDHFTSYHEKERSHGSLQKDHDKLKDEKEATEIHLRKKLEEYRHLLQQMQTRKEGLLRRQKNKGAALFGSKWQVQQVSLVGQAIICKNPGKVDATAGSAEKHTTFRLSGTSTVTSVDDRKHAFCIKSTGPGTGGTQEGADDELVLCAVDKGDMDEWVTEIEAAVEALRGKTEGHERRFMQLQAEDMAEEEAAERNESSPEVKTNDAVAAGRG